MSSTSRNEDRSHHEKVAKVAELIGDTRICMFTTLDAGGRLVSRPMGVVDAKFDGDLWFVSRENARKIEHIRAGSRVNAGFSSKHAWVSVSGEAEVVRDVEKAKELWGPGISGWFPEGPEDPSIVLVKVQANGAEYWDTPGTVTASLLSFFKAQATGESYDVDNQSVAL